MTFRINESIYRKRVARDLRRIGFSRWKAYSMSWKMLRQARDLFKWQATRRKP